MPDELLLRSRYAVGQPQYPCLLHQWMEHLQICIGQSLFPDKPGQFFPELFLTETQRRHDQVSWFERAVSGFLSRTCPEHFAQQIIVTQLCYLRYLHPVPVKDGDCDKLLQLLLRVMPDIGIAPLRCKDPVPLFPHSDGMCFYTTEILQILYGVCPASCIHLSLCYLLWEYNNEGG